MQLAFARVKESWDDANLTNLATQPLELVVEKARTAAKVGLFTTEQSPPQAVAQPLLDRKIDYFIAYVCENLGSPDERVTHGELGRNRQAGVFAPQRDDPRPQAERAGPAALDARPQAVRQSR